jgi:hypothetical protein
MHQASHQSSLHHLPIRRACCQLGRLDVWQNHHKQPPSVHAPLTNVWRGGGRFLTSKMPWCGNLSHLATLLDSSSAWSKPRSLWRTLCKGTGKTTSTSIFPLRNASSTSWPTNQSQPVDFLKLQQHDGTDRRVFVTRHAASLVETETSNRQVAQSGSKIEGGLAIGVFRKLRFNRQSANVADVGTDARKRDASLIANGQSRSANEQLFAQPAASRPA